MKHAARAGEAGLGSALAVELADYLAEKAGQLRDILDASQDMISLNRFDTTFVYVSPACRDIVGYSPDELLGRRARDLVHPEDREAARAATRRLIAGEPTMSEFRMLRRDGEPVWVESTARPPDPGRDTIAVVTRDVSERREWQELLMTAALHDPVTGLANRRLFDDRLDAEIARASRGGATLAVLFVDLDGFKLLNDRLGHVAGDQVLRQVADRISTHVRAGDLAARYGGDEFIVVCVDLHSSEEAAQTAMRMRGELARPYRVAGREETTTASIGVAVWRPGMTATELVDIADRAMYAVKRGSITVTR